METLEKIEFLDKSIYKGRELDVKKDDEGIHFYEVNKATGEICGKELPLHIVKWCVEKGKLSKEVEKYF